MCVCGYVFMCATELTRALANALPELAKALLPEELKQATELTEVVVRDCFVAY